MPDRVWNILMFHPANERPTGGRSAVDRNTVMLQMRPKGRVDAAQAEFVTRDVPG